MSKSLTNVRAIPQWLAISDARMVRNGFLPAVPMSMGREYKRMVARRNKRKARALLEKGARND